MMKTINFRYSADDTQVQSALFRTEKLIILSISKLCQRFYIHCLLSESIFGYAHLSELISEVKCIVYIIIMFAIFREPDQNWSISAMF
jgi:hypothetical protein